MNSQTGPWLDVPAADLRAAGAIWWRERRSCGRSFGRCLNSGGDRKRLRQIAYDVVLSCVCAHERWVRCRRVCRRLHHRV